MEIGWQDWKTALADHANLSRDALHIYAAVLIFILACKLLRARPADWRPWLAVLAAQLVNEAFDIRDMIEDDGVIWIWASVKDTINTMIIPTVLMAAARRWELFGAAPASGDEAEVAGTAAGGEDDTG